ncbi:MAG: hypothetical protein ACOYEV_17820, partial [Candidatus Nanopelagicales bacterium]
MTKALSVFTGQRVDCGSGNMAEMDERAIPGPDDPFEAAIDEALNSLPANLREAISNVEIVV